MTTLTILPGEISPDEPDEFDKNTHFAGELARVEGLPANLRADLLVMRNTMVFLQECRKVCKDYALQLARRPLVNDLTTPLEAQFDSLRRAAKVMILKIADHFLYKNTDALEREIVVGETDFDSFHGLLNVFDKLGDFLSAKKQEVGRHLKIELAEMTHQKMTRISKIMDVLYEGRDRACVILAGRPAFSRRENSFEKHIRELICADEIIQNTAGKILALIEKRPQPEELAEASEMYSLLGTHVELLASLEDIPSGERQALNTALGRTERIIEGDIDNAQSVRNAAVLLYTKLMELTLSLKGRIINALNSGDAQVFIQ